MNLRNSDRWVPRRRSTRNLIKAHSLIGLFSAALVVVLVITGWALNHNDGLALGARHIKNDWILDLYRISEKPGVQEISSQGLVLATIDDAVFLDAIFLLSTDDTLLGIASYNDVAHVFSSSLVRMYTEQGELIETAILPATISAVGALIDSTLVLELEGGGITGLSLVSFQLELPSTSLPTRWQAFAKRDNPSYPSIVAGWRERRLTLEQALLDIHSGRIFGSIGVWLVDLFGLLLLVLASTGLIVRFRRRRRRSHQIR
ncbi:MAG: hypothetical protein HOM55_07300 [Proteobacteria bacterium]|jgi:hypothetical protein|nr:hypothetical protein [Pseudomonadota bacterium]